MDEFIMQFNFLSWNVRRQNNPAKQEDVRQLIKLVRPDLVYLQETKLENITTATIRNVLGLEFERDFVFLPAAGKCGGVFSLLPETPFLAFNFIEWM
jgi:exonuclease III